MSDTLRQDIIFKILKMAKDNSDLSSDDLFNQVESATSSMFNQLTQSNAESTPKDKDKDDKARTKRRMKRKDRNQRKEHVGRFFINLMEKNIKQPGIPDCLIPVFANSVQSTISEDAYTQLSGKIDRLLEFGEKKGFDYEQILDSKPGKTIATEILTLYNAETNSSSFEKQLRNNLDETLVKNIESIENGQELNIEDTVNLAFDEFSKYLKTT
ncbi:MAG: hypothetical protein HN472_14095 [Nitrospina sp.]|jgi:hypothetical protein|nr:hypothetical protein [Nitrospina sp.]MBT3510666.1 hypothetical protein [Nitrospina sp.]MBT3877407.1 hypothetical protein [Nitrospina sp.]MBT4046727.1 hypothetical protein [Nitrospina sp.]MBT4556232.1 hypothetical protein [Nitrospina sp.]